MAIKFSAKAQPAATPAPASPAKAVAAAKAAGEPAATDLFNAPAEPGKGKPKKKKT
ncbi:hypothetical protein [Mesorhizobium comanense]|uniref:hypothetical protein n=1 Tax=Mesorhizobium comanense TaxID=2502215 RepID=UPI0014859C09|nr:hypothetical protein [Mesorhizobium comanense]